MQSQRTDMQYTHTVTYTTDLKLTISYIDSSFSKIQLHAGLGDKRYTANQTSYCTELKICEESPVLYLLEVKDLPEQKSTKLLFASHPTGGLYSVFAKENFLFHSRGQFLDPALITNIYKTYKHEDPDWIDIRELGGIQKDVKYNVEEINGTKYFTFVQKSNRFIVD